MRAFALVDQRQSDFRIWPQPCGDTNGLAQWHLSASARDAFVVLDALERSSNRLVLPNIVRGKARASGEMVPGHRGRAVEALRRSLLADRSGNTTHRTIEIRRLLHRRFHGAGHSMF
jgi:hypothetical protein